MKAPNHCLFHLPTHCHLADTSITLLGVQDLASSCTYNLKLYRRSFVINVRHKFITNFNNYPLTYFIHVSPLYIAYCLSLSYAFYIHWFLIVRFCGRPPKYCGNVEARKFVVTCMIGRKVCICEDPKIQTLFPLLYSFCCMFSSTDGCLQI